MTETVPGWSWCPVMERPVKDSEGHRPAAATLCAGTPHRILLLGEVHPGTATNCTCGAHPCSWCAPCWRTLEAKALTLGQCGYCWLNGMVCTHLAEHANERHAATDEDVEQLAEALWRARLPGDLAWAVWDHEAVLWKIHYRNRARRAIEGSRPTTERDPAPPRDPERHPSKRVHSGGQ